jgi:hypothetical protein
MGRATWPYRADYRRRSEGEMNPTNAIALLPEIFKHQVHPFGSVQNSDVRCT